MTMFRKSLIAVAALGVFGCSHANEAEREQEERAAADQSQRRSQAGRSPTATAPRPRPDTAPARTAPPDSPLVQDSETRDADNTGINERDRKGAGLTPLDQGNSAEDTRITADIRKALMKDDSLSFNAKNVKVITRSGNVVLRGPVKTTLEKARIDAVARTVGGVLEVDDQLEVEPPKD